ncbi:MAG: DUF998 domain-containing protein, partial [Desulfovibrionales bacterium]
DMAPYPSPNGRFGTLPVPGFLFFLGIANFCIALLTVGAALYIYINYQHPTFSPFATSISEVGASREWAARALNSGLLILGALRFLFFYLLIRRYSMRDNRPNIRRIWLFLALVETLGGIGVAMVPYSFNLTGHYIAAGTYFLGLTLMMGLLFWYEITMKVGRLLPATTLAVAIPPLVYLILNTVLGIQKVAIWEWLAFAALLCWELVHCLLLRNDFLEPE